MAKADILDEVRQIKRLLAAFVTSGLNQKDAVARLSSAGFAPKDIASLIGTTPNSVRVALSNLKKESKRRKNA